MRKILQLLLIICLFALFGCDKSEKYSNNEVEKAIEDYDNYEDESFEDFLERSKNEIISDIDNERFWIAESYYSSILEILKEEEVDEYSESLAMMVIDLLEEAIDSNNFTSKNKRELLDGIRSIGIQNEELDSAISYYEDGGSRDEFEWVFNEDSQSSGADFEQTIVQYLKKVKAAYANHSTFEKERIITDWSEDIGLYKTFITEEIELLIEYIKEGEKLETVVLEIEILDKSDPKYGEWKYDVSGAVNTTILSLDPYMTDDEIYNLTEEIVEFENFEVDYNNYSKKVRYKGALYELWSESGTLNFLAKEELID